MIDKDNPFALVIFEVSVSALMSKILNHLKKRGLISFTFLYIKVLLK